MVFPNNDTALQLHPDNDINNTIGLKQNSSGNGNERVIENGIWPDIYSKIPASGFQTIAPNVSGTTELQDTSTARVMVITWNLQAQKPPQDLASILQPGKFHLYAIGTEECCNTIAKSMIFKSKKEWELCLQLALGEEYSMIASHGLQAIHNIVFAHQSVLPLIQEKSVRSCAIPTGLGNQMGNKGGVGITLTLGRTSMIFVSCHFEAHQNRVEKRNANFQ